MTEYTKDGCIKVPPGTFEFEDVDETDGKFTIIQTRKRDDFMDDVLKELDDIFKGYFWI